MTSGADAETRLNDFLAEQMRLLNGPQLPRNLYHYTPAAGMKAIIASGVLRAHNLGQMNDFAEARYAASVMRAHVDRGYAVEPNPHAIELLNAIRQQLSTVDLSNVFALSFTLDGDEPGMWRLYADLSRGFSFAVPFHEAVRWAGLDHKGMMLKCSYDPDILTEFCARTLAKMREIYLDDVGAGLQPNPRSAAAVFLGNVSWFAPAFKPDVWHDEQEWRFVFSRPQIEHKALPGGRTCVELPLARPAAGKQSPIVAICAGPD
jgi:hypothetical protein